jgi:translation initiation factor 5B
MRAPTGIFWANLTPFSLWQIRALMTTAPMQELRVKNSYILHDRLRAAQGIKIAATGLEEAIAGSAVMVYK